MELGLRLPRFAIKKENIYWMAKDVKVDDERSEFLKASERVYLNDEKSLAVSIPGLTYKKIPIISPGRVAIAIRKREIC